MSQKKVMCKVKGCKKGLGSKYNDGYCPRHYKLSKLPIGTMGEKPEETGEYY